MNEPIDLAGNKLSIGDLVCYKHGNRMLWFFITKISDHRIQIIWAYYIASIDDALWVNPINVLKITEEQVPWYKIQIETTRGHYERYGIL